MFLIIKSGPNGVQMARTISSKVPDGFVGPGESAFVVVALDFQVSSELPELKHTHDYPLGMGHTFTKENND